MFGWLRRIFGGGEVQAPANPPAATPAAPVVPPAAVAPSPAPPLPPPPTLALPSGETLVGLNIQALTENYVPPPPPPAPAPAAPTLAPPAAEELVLLVHVARAGGRRARRSVLAALEEMLGMRPNLAHVPRRSQVTRALNRLSRQPGRAAALLAQAEVVAAAARARLPATLFRLSRRG